MSKLSNIQIATFEAEVVANLNLSDMVKSYYEKELSKSDLVRMIMFENRYKSNFEKSSLKFWLNGLAENSDDALPINSSGSYYTAFRDLENIANSCHILIDDLDEEDYSKLEESYNEVVQLFENDLV